MSLQASLLTGIFGWWGFPWGPIWTIGSILGNAFGGNFSKEIDEKLIWYNALAFLSKGKLAISYALAQQVRAAQDADIAIHAVRLMDHLRSVGVPANSPALKNAWSIKPQFVLLHILMLCALPLLIGIVSGWDDISRQLNSTGGVATRNGATSQSASLASQDKWQGAPLSSRQVPTQNAAKTATCLLPPGNGDVLSGKNFLQDGHSIEIRNGTGGNAIIKIRDAMSSRLAVSFFVERGQTASFDNLPDGNYRVQYALGDDLQTDCHTFVQPTAVEEFPGTTAFVTEVTSTQIVRQVLSYTLYAVPNGNVRPQRIDLASFNAN